MKKVIFTILAIAVLGYVAYPYVLERIALNNIVPTTEEVLVPALEEVANTIDEVNEELLPELPERTVIAEQLTIPWDIVFVSDTKLLVAERAGTVQLLDTTAGTASNIEVPGVVHKGEGGLLGMVAHPDFATNSLVYVYRTSNLAESPNVSINEVVRYRFTGDALTEEMMVVGNIPGSLFHNGGRIAFGPDGYLYIATGDARTPESAQDLSSLAGKILRVTDTGDVPVDNPFGTAVYSYGHRNPQGLTWDSNNRLWSTEHGRTTATLTGMDELNLIEKGGNYGWPASEGETVQPGTIAPAIHSGAATTWAPGGATYYDGSIFFGGLKGERLYEAVLDETQMQVVELREHFIDTYGRIRTTLLGPDGGLYLLTSNRDGRGDVNTGDDTIVRFNPRQFKQ